MKRPLASSLLAHLLSLLAISFLLAPITLGLQAEGDEDPEGLRLFFVGNSYTFYNDLPGMVAGLAAAADPPISLDIASETQPGYSLDIHWRNQQERDFLGDRAWDVVVLQEQSQAPLRKKDRMLEFARHFAETVAARGGRVVLYMTWAPERRQAVIESLASAYEEVGAAIGADVAPVGRAWQRVRAERPDIVLYRPDGSHPDVAGTYLAACVLLAEITRLDPRGLPGPEGASLAAEDLAYLQTVAWESTGGSSRSDETGP